MTTTLNPTRTPLADALVAEDEAEDTGWLDPLDRLTCPVHRRWVHECLHSQLHVNAVAGHRWCRPCKRELAVVTDQLTGTVTLHCPGCHRGPRTRADAQVVSAATASMFAARR